MEEEFGTRSTSPDYLVREGDKHRARKEYEKAISRPFEGIAFDLDGTALDDDGNLRPKVVRLLSYLSRCHVPVIVATGRGEGSTDEKVVAVLERAGANLEHIIISNYNGGKITRHEYASDGRLTKRVLYEAPLPYASDIFTDLTEQSPWATSIVTEGSSFVSKARNYGVTLVFQDDHLPDVDAVKKYLEHRGFNECKVVSSGRTIDVISKKAGKDVSIAVVGDKLLLNTERILRVGDRGQPGENDSDMLNHPAGFTVGTRDCSQPSGIANLVVDPRGDIVTGVDGFGQLLFDVNWKAGVVVHRSMFNKKYSRQGYMDAYHKLAEQAKDRFNSLILGFEVDIVTRNARSRLVSFEDLAKKVSEWRSERSSLRDEFSYNGCLTITEGELLSLPRSPLRDFVMTKSKHYGDEDHPRYKYALLNVGRDKGVALEKAKYRLAALNVAKTNSDVSERRALEILIKLLEQQAKPGNRKVFLRGEAYYATMQDSEKPIDRFNRLVEEHQALAARYEEIKGYISSRELSYAEWKVALAYFDHYRNTHLQIYHAYSYLQTAGMFPVDREQMEQFTEDLQGTLSSAVGAYYDLLNMDRPREIPQNDTFSKAAQLVLTVLGAEYDDSAVGKKVEKAVRGLAEGDHPLYEQMYAIAAADKLAKLGKEHYVLAGIHYGGIELPYVLSAQLDRKHPTISYEHISVHYSKYSNRELGSRKVSRMAHIVDRKIDLKGQTIVLCDDGVFSGESLYRVGLLAVCEGADVIFSTMAIGNSRRVGQMMEAGGVDPDFIIDELNDMLVRVSPFARAETPESYRDQLNRGKFNLVKRMVSEMLSREYPADIATGNDVFRRLRSKTRQSQVAQGSTSS